MSLLAATDDAPARPAVLYLVHRFPYPPDKGDRIRAFHILRALSARADVDVACLADEPPAEGDLAALRASCRRLAVVRLGRHARWARALGSLARGGTVTEGAFDSPALRAVVRRWAAETNYRGALASASSMVPYLRINGLREIPAVVDLVDVDSQKWLDYAAASRGPRAWLHAIEGRRLRRVERSLQDWARAVTLVSEAEATLYRELGGGRAVAVTNGVDLDYFRPSPGVEGQGCIFVGALDYRPNVDGIRWFCSDVWPEVRRRHPRATLAVVGRRPVATVRRLARLPGVEVVGQVPDVRPHLAAAAVAIAPLRIARGLQNKVLEALAMGKAVVASPQSLAGLRAEAGVHALAATGPSEWSSAIDRLLVDPELCHRLGSAGRAYAERRHDWERCLLPLGELLGLGVEIQRPNNPIAADHPAGLMNRPHARG